MAFFIEGSSSDSNITDEDRENLKKIIMVFLNIM